VCGDTGGAVTRRGVEFWFGALTHGDVHQLPEDTGWEGLRPPSDWLVGGTPNLDR